ncbi:MAG: DUF29 domain-containing protein [Thiomargarita sp.]|nr:DUF29 domain-containing protein [Thiomargarita sp.]
MKLMVNYQDFYAWIQQQIGWLRSKKFGKLDLERLIKELEGMANAEVRVLESHFIVLLRHLLKCKYQADLQSPSWILSIKQQRRRILKRLQQCPSLKDDLKEIITDAYSIAKGDVADEIGLAESNFPIKCPWKFEQIMNMKF